jgi:hypothetical protein
LCKQPTEETLGTLVVKKPRHAREQTIHEVVAKPVDGLRWRYQTACAIKSSQRTKFMWLTLCIDTEQGPRRAKATHISERRVTSAPRTTNMRDTSSSLGKHARDRRLTHPERDAQFARTGWPPQAEEIDQGREAIQGGGHE